MVLHPGYDLGCAAAFRHNHIIRSLYGQKCYRRFRYSRQKMSVNVASTFFGIALLKIQWLSLKL
jgi:hypothetical protein